MKQGGRGVYLETAQHNKRSEWGGRLPPYPIFPLKANTEVATGLWIGVSHIVTDHPVFKGLPSKRMMGQTYENIFARNSLTEIHGELIVGSVSYGFFSWNNDLRNYHGPSPAWYGMDMGVVRHGKGQYVLSALRVLENLGADPVADKILFNLIDWTCTDKSGRRR